MLTFCVFILVFLLSVVNPSLGEFRRSKGHRSNGERRNTRATTKSFLTGGKKSFWRRRSDTLVLRWVTVLPPALCAGTFRVMVNGCNVRMNTPGTPERRDVSDGGAVGATSESGAGICRQLALAVDLGSQTLAGRPETEGFGETCLPCGAD